VAGIEIASDDSGAQAVLWDGGTPRPLPHQLFDFVTAVNPAGLAAGSSDQKAVVWRQNRRTTLPPTSPDNVFTTAAAMSNDGRVGGGISPGSDGTIGPAIWTCQPVEPRVALPGRQGRHARR
jgi:hypothetical protein